MTTTHPNLLHPIKGTKHYYNIRNIIFYIGIIS